MTKTALVCTVIVIVLAIYDLIAIQVGGIDNSVSKWFCHYGLNTPYLVFTLGYLAGHFWGFMSFCPRLFKVRHCGVDYLVHCNTMPTERAVKRVLKLSQETKLGKIEEVKMYVV